VRTPIQLLRTEGGDLTDIAEAINRFLINWMEHMAADIDDGTRLVDPPHAADGRTRNVADSRTRNVAVPKFALTPTNESTVIDLLRKLNVSKAMCCMQGL